MNKNYRKKYYRCLVHLSSKKTSLKSKKKYKNRKQAECYRTKKRKKNFVKWDLGDSNLGPLVYEASVLPTELSFRIKN